MHGKGRPGRQIRAEVDDLITDAGPFRSPRIQWAAVRKHLHKRGDQRELSTFCQELIKRLWYLAQCRSAEHAQE
jgi:hypothetical protein